MHIWKCSAEILDVKLLCRVGFVSGWIFVLSCIFGNRTFKTHWTVSAKSEFKYCSSTSQVCGWTFNSMNLFEHCGAADFSIFSKWKFEILFSGFNLVAKRVCKPVLQAEIALGDSAFYHIFLRSSYTGIRMLDITSISLYCIIYVFFSEITLVLSRSWWINWWMEWNQMEVKSSLCSFYRFRSSRLKTPEVCHFPFVLGKRQFDTFASNSYPCFNVSDSSSLLQR